MVRPLPRIVGPVIDEDRWQYASQVDVVKVDVETSGDTAMSTASTSIPAIYLFRVARSSEDRRRFKTKPALLAEILQHLG